MKGIYFDGKESRYREDLEKPIPEKEESLVRIIMAAICNTDKEILRGYRPDFQGVMGHEFVGIVEESPDSALIGKRVVGELNATCGTCIYCTTGRKTHCNSRRVLGMHGKDGCFAQYMTIDTSLLHILPEQLSTKQAIYTEPLAAAFEILTQITPQPEHNIAILGDGRLAYCIAQAFSAGGFPFTVIGKHEEKLKLFQPFGDIVLSGDIAEQEQQYEIIIEATGSPTGIRQALSMVRKKGIVVLKSTYAGETSLPFSQIAVNEITIIGSRCGPFEPAIEALAEGKAVFPEIELYDLRDYQDAFLSKKMKAGFRFD